MVFLLPSSNCPLRFLGTFDLSAVSVMLERYDSSGRPRVRPGKSAETHEANHFGDRDRVDCGRRWSGGFAIGLKNTSSANSLLPCRSRITRPPTASGCTIRSGSSIPTDHPKYPFNEFYRDWGPGGEWGLIKTQKVYGASTCPGGGSGVVVDVIVNDRAEHAQVWVEKSDHTLSYPPCELIFR